MSRTYPPRPIIAVAGLLFRGDKALLVKRAKDPGRGRWSIPGGAVETGETLHEGLKREMLEETGLSVEVGPLIEILERILPDNKERIMYHYVILDYLCFASDSEEPRPGSDASEAYFVGPDQWAEYGLGRQKEFRSLSGPRPCGRTRLEKDICHGPG